MSAIWYWSALRSVERTAPIERSSSDGTGSDSCTPHPHVSAPSTLGDIQSGRVGGGRARVRRIGADVDMADDRPAWMDEQSPHESDVVRWADLVQRVEGADFWGVGGRLAGGGRAP
jgi:hypothetical protein